jgi:superfamily I DNA/RNA helicase
MSNPTLPCDYVMFDEAQDANPVIAAIVASQTEAQRIYVGDRNQQLYAWRGAVDALDQVDGVRLPLTRSFRFGPVIADQANFWLAQLGSELRVEGAGAHEGRVTVLDDAVSGRPDAYLCRGNGTAIGKVLNLLDAGERVALAPGDRNAGADIRSFAFAALDLQRGNGTDHYELSAFRSWTDLLTYIEEEENTSDLKRMVGIINQVGAPRVIDAIRRLSPREQATVMVSTAHKAKGLEWDRVKVADDFAPPTTPEGEPAVPDPAELMLAYVTVTRAKRELDPGSLATWNWGGPQPLSYPGDMMDDDPHDEAWWAGVRA